MSHAPDLFRQRNFLLYFGGRLFSNFARQIVAVAVGWQVYDLTGSALHLGLVGLVQFVPALLFVLHGGSVADRHDRKRVVQVCQSVEGVTAAWLAWRSFTGGITVLDIYAAAAIFGAASAYERPATGAMLPNLVPLGVLQQAIALSTGAFQLATIAGPALGGFIFAASATVCYAAIAGFWLLGGIMNGALPTLLREAPPPADTLREQLAGVRFIRGNPNILGTISLDLVAVLLAGATALLPIYARDILHTDAVGLGLLRSAPAAGALVTTAILARRPFQRRVGMRMFQAVIVFGIATVVFGISTDLALSLAALAIMGAADQISVVIRNMLVQVNTPDEMRGRVGAINFLFISASNQLGEFRAGVTAAWWGAIPAVVVGGVGSVLVALLWMRLFPALRDVERLTD
ncbi:MAG: MFS transporter [Pseudomonadota bacterium]|nr:MAG: MFS transporter [Pseudomonadota bacterium]